MTYEELLLCTDSEGVAVIDYKFNSDRIKGLYCNGTIAINSKIPTSAEKSCILSEELGHYHTTAGDILDQSVVGNRKQELQARMWAYNRLIGLTGLINAQKAGCTNLYEVAEYLEVTEEFLRETIECYKSKYGLCTTVDNYVIYFEPAIAVLELI